ncbi:HAMP domain-containing sensor histidine kinase [Collinsella sp. An2]|uniref:sensor histidine kinase n=1 Tax=Collinsella sp. An2 TaxID=1965585 RepID=UPI000B369800|nr:HAMP domain-containing sensor histidine kinase [Collinsella sp. An2]OUP09773.1 hypothetical protein B5F33_04085 [Collinsella sp. An2]
MFRAIARSLSAKVFLLTAALLAAGCLALYAAVALALPGGYRALSAARAEEAAAALAAELSGADASEAAGIVERFAAENGAAVSLSGEPGAAASGDGAPEGSAYTVSVAVELADGTSELLTITDSSGALGIIADALLRLFPPAAALILAVSAAGAWVCARLVAQPVVEIADVSERLSRLDMTWSCDEGRTDEVGVLARSLNAMAARLERTISDLTDANGRLRAEAEEASARERERRDFLAAASHELKTPLAAARAQVEGMMLGIGDFSDHAAHLPRALAAIDRMDALVREMLAAARADELPPEAPEAVDVRALAASAVASARGLAASRGVELALLDCGPCPVLAERSALEIAVSNAVSNAARHALPGTRATVSIEGGALRVENRCEPLPPEAVARLSEPFFRPDSSRSRDAGGSGLGLHLAARALERLGARLALSCEGGAFVFEADLTCLAAPARTED